MSRGNQKRVSTLRHQIFDKNVLKFNLNFKYLHTLWKCGNKGTQGYIARKITRFSSALGLERCHDSAFLCLGHKLMKKHDMQICVTQQRCSFRQNYT